jgi:uncharacterized sulfatase
MPHKPLAASGEFYTPESKDDLYADVIRELDWSTGEIIKALEEGEILDRTIVIFLSDNGATYGGNNRPLKGRKHDNWEGGVRVPFMARYPELLPQGKVIETPCWSADIFPTLLSMCGIGWPDNLVLDGENITDVLLGESQEHGPVFTMKQDKIKTIRKGKWKMYIGKPVFYKPVDLETWSDWRAPDGKTIIAPFEQATPAQYPGIKPMKMEGDVFLFNLDQDIAEMTNVAGSHPEIVEELEQLYNAFIISLDEEK